LMSSAIVAAALAWAMTRTATTSSPPTAAFMERYVTTDGRVVRPEAGGDTAGEEQAYAMLLAAFTGDRAAFDRTWRWSVAHLRGDDGLLASRWQDGRVVDRRPSSESDVLAAWALAAAAAHFGSDGYAADGRRLGAAVLANETVRA